MLQLEKEKDYKGEWSLTADKKGIVKEIVEIDDYKVDLYDIIQIMAQYGAIRVYHNFTPLEEVVVSTEDVLAFMNGDIS